MSGEPYDNLMRDASDVHLPIVFEDEVLLAVDKPAGLIVHADGTGAPTLTDLVEDHLGACGHTNARGQAVQRLDAPTTGLVLFSLDKATQPLLDAQVAGHTMRKRYLAVVAGRTAWESRVVDAPMGRDRHDSRRMRVCRPGQGKPAQTRVRRLAAAGGRTLLVVELGSGRRHQIRVHLASLGFPIVGDVLYGGARSKEGLLLHAYAEELDHPVSGERLRLHTVWPARLGSWPGAERLLGS